MITDQQKKHNLSHNFSSEESIKKDPPKKEIAKKNHVVHAALFGLSIIAMGSSFYAIYTNLQWRERSEQQSTLLNHTIDDLTNQQTKANTSVTDALNETNTAQKALTERVIALNQNLHKTLQQRWYQNNDWLLLKVRYYLELAQINAHWSDQTQTTAALLEEADGLLNALHDEQLFPIRQSIAKEINTLKSAPQMDMVKILSQLDALQNAVLNISTLQLPTPIKNGPQSSDIQEPKDNTWQARWAKTLDVIEKLVVIQHHDTPVEPLLPEQNIALIRENIRLGLQEAQWAVLRLNKDLFHLLLTQAITNINRSFDIHAPNTEALLKQLDDLQQLDFEKPDFTPHESLLLLNQYIDSKKITEVPESLQTAPESTEPTS